MVHNYYEETFFDEIKQGKFDEGGTGFHFHQMVTNDESGKIKSGDKTFLKNFAKTLYEREIPLFDTDDQLFVEIYCARWTFTVTK